MKFSTQHIRVSNGHDNYQLHRDGKLTWQTVDSKGESTVTHLIEHDTVAQAKAVFGDITSVGK